MHHNMGFFKVGATTGMDVLLADLREGYSAMPLMIRRLGARNPARPAYLTAMFVLIARPLVFAIALLLAGRIPGSQSSNHERHRAV
ncbi:hypothetical protein, partial [Mesorhizobium sp.]|uniref:hypothetical protein n=1 Tax=Mesorhizobium sp. TaxID=1871066 RepID=UPI0025BA2608